MLLENTKMTQHYAPQMTTTVSELPASELDWTVSFSVRQTGLLLLSLGPGDLRLDPVQRKAAALIPCFQGIYSRLSCACST